MVIRRLCIPGMELEEGRRHFLALAIAKSFQQAVEPHLKAGREGLLLLLSSVGPITLKTSNTGMSGPLHYKIYPGKNNQKKCVNTY